MQFLLIALLIGIAGGIIGPLFGVGGGIVMVPAFLKGLGMVFHKAVATSLAVIVLTSLVASVKNGKAGLIDYKVAAIAGIGSVVAAWFAAGWMQKQSAPTLERLFAVFLISLGIYFLWRSFKLTTA